MPFDPGDPEAGRLVKARQRSRLAAWMRRHHAELSADLAALREDGARPDWTALAEEIAGRGVVAPGTSPHTIRSAWARTRAWAARRAARARQAERRPAVAVPPASPSPPPPVPAHRPAPPLPAGGAGAKGGDGAYALALMAAGRRRFPGQR